jgi:hypothetical protein
MRLILINCFLFILFYCSDPTKPEYRYNDDIKFLDFDGNINLHMAVWCDNNLYTANRLYKLTLANEFSVERDSLFESLLDTTIEWGFNYKFIEADENGTKLLLVRSLYSDVSAGSLYELNLETQEYTLLIESIYNVSSAVYWHGDDSKIVYYQYGNPVGQDPGYYLYDKNTKQSVLLLEHIAPCGPSEMLNGFDLHPDNTILLIPAVRAPRLSNKSPKIILYNISEKIIDTLSVDFDLSHRRIGLWLRYNSDASKILYCNFPRGSFTETTNDDSEVGIIELLSLDKKILDVNTNFNNDMGTYKSVQIAPNWSPDEKSIVYGSGHLSIEGARGTIKLYILRNVN